MFPASCSKLSFVTLIILSILVFRGFKHIVTFISPLGFIGRTKWIFNPPIVNININPNANNIEALNLNDPP